jgi:hypothetical protein
MAARIDVFPAAILNFLKNLFFRKTCKLLTPNECKKKIEKMLGTLRFMQKKKFEPPFWIEPPFLINLTKYAVFLLGIYLEFPSRMLSTHTFAYVSVIDMLTLNLFEWTNLVYDTKKLTYQYPDY